MTDVIICDDHPVVRRGVAAIIRTELEATALREADSGQALLEMLRRKPADVVLLDVGLPGRGGLDVLRDVRQEWPKLPVLMLSVHAPEHYAVRALRAGASGYLTKDLVPQAIVEAVKTVISGRRYLTPEVAERLADDLHLGGDRHRHETLSDREFEVMILLGLGRQVRDIARELSLSYNTISTYRARIMAKLNLDGDAALIRYVLRHRLVD